MTILAFGAHSDDIEYYAGGTLAGLAGDHQIMFVIATNGENGTHQNISREKLVRQRRQEQTRSAKIIGAREIINLGFTDGELEYEVRNLKKKILEILVLHRPGMIFSFDPEKQHVVHDDFHPDHRTLAHAVLDVTLIDATLPGKGGISGFKPKIYLYNPHQANTEIDISPTIIIKNRCLKKFTSQKDVITKQQTGNLTECFKIF